MAGDVPSVAIAITGASGAIYATRTLAALLERGVHVELIVSDYGRRLLRDSSGAAAVEQLAVSDGAIRCRRRRGQRHAAQQPRSRCDDRQRQPWLLGQPSFRAR
jgi:3-polyprenyl-4-hydroxybenzoate decarboxylase